MLSILAHSAHLSIIKRRKLKEKKGKVISVGDVTTKVYAT